MEKYGTWIEPSEEEVYGDFSYKDNIDGKFIGISKDKIVKVQKWRILKYWEKIHKVCIKLRVYNEYILKKNGNRGEEIGQFEILRDILKKSSTRMRTLNFQAVYGTGGIKWCFEKFFSINLRNFKKEFELFKENIKKRHQILHGSLKDDEINKEFVEQFKASIDIFISYLNSHISSLYMSRKSFDSIRLN